MKNILITATLLITLGDAFSQNMGIGTTSPAFPLTVVANANGIGIVQKTGTMEMGLVNNAASGGWLKTLSNHNLNFGVNHVSGSVDPAMTLSTSGNIGIGTGSTAPTYKLDLKGRMRLRHNSVLNQTAGFWLDGNTLPTRSFIGTINENHVGIYGNGGTGWNFVMNVMNGNTGIGTSTPTAGLDINGTLRLRSNTVKTGSVLTSNDENGNTDWQSPVAFRAWGSPDGNSTVYNLPTGSMTVKYNFSTSPDYNLGLHYNANTSEFTAPVNGVYHFDAQVAFELENAYANISIFVINTYGYTVNAKHSGIRPGSPYPEWNFDVFDVVRGAFTPTISTDLQLNAGERVFVKISRSSVYPEPLNESVDPDTRLTWFSGHLVTRL